MPDAPAQDQVGPAIATNWADAVLAKPATEQLTCRVEARANAVGSALYLTDYNEPVVDPTSPVEGSLEPNYCTPAAYFAGDLTPEPRPLSPLDPEPQLLPLLSLDAQPTAAEPTSIAFERAPLHQRLWGEIKTDDANFYSYQNLLVLNAGVGVGAVLANTSFDGRTFDQRPRDDYQDHISNRKFFHEFKTFGNGYVVIPVIAASTLAEEVWPDTVIGDTVGQWGERSVRALLVGTPPLLFLQEATGGARPGESSNTSHWGFWQADHGLSGHAFTGGVAFIPAAEMTDDPFLKSGFYALSVLPGISRIYDNEHYTSQVLLGYFLANVACSAVDLTDSQNEHVAFAPLVNENIAGVGFEVLH
jgi:hypothetical protein